MRNRHLLDSLAEDFFGVMCIIFNASILSDPVGVSLGPSFQIVICNIKQGPFNKYQDWFQKSKFIAGIITITWPPHWSSG